MAAESRIGTYNRSFFDDITEEIDQYDINDLQNEEVITRQRIFPRKKWTPEAVAKYKEVWESLFHVGKEVVVPHGDLRSEPCETTLVYENLSPSEEYYPNMEPVQVLMDTQEKLSKDRKKLYQFYKLWDRRPTRFPEDWYDLPIYSSLSHKFFLSNIPMTATVESVTEDIDRQVQVAYPYYKATDVYFLQDMRCEELCNHAIVTISSTDHSKVDPIVKLTDHFTVFGIYVAGVRCSLYSAETYKSLILEVSPEFLSRVSNGGKMTFGNQERPIQLLTNMGIKEIANFDGEYEGQSGEQDLVSVTFKTHNDAYKAFQKISDLVSRPQLEPLILSVEWNGGVSEILLADHPSSFDSK